MWVFQHHYNFIIHIQESVALQESVRIEEDKRTEVCGIGILHGNLYVCKINHICRNCLCFKIVYR